MQVYMCCIQAFLEVARHCLLMGSRGKKIGFFSLFVFIQTVTFALVNFLILTHVLFSILYPLPCAAEEVSDREA